MVARGSVLTVAGLLTVAAVGARRAGDVAVESGPTVGAKATAARRLTPDENKHSNLCAIRGGKTVVDGSFG